MAIPFQELIGLVGWDDRKPESPLPPEERMRRIRQAALDGDVSGGPVRQTRPARAPMPAVGPFAVDPGTAALGPDDPNPGYEPPSDLPAPRGPAHAPVSRKALPDPAMSDVAFDPGVRMPAGRERGDFWGALATLAKATEGNPFPYQYTGDFKSNPAGAIFAMLSGLGNQMSRVAYQDDRDREAFNQSQAKMAEARNATAVANRDAAFKLARAEADRVRANKEKRIEQIRAAIEKREVRLENIRSDIAKSISEVEVEGHTASAKVLERELEGLRRDLAKLTGEAPAAAEPFNYQTQPGRPPRAGSANPYAGNFTPEQRAKMDETVRAVLEGRMNPELIRSLPSRDPARNYLIFELGASGADINLLANRARGQSTFWATVNGRQFTLLRGAQMAVKDLLKQVLDANREVAKLGILSKSPTLNKTILAKMAREGVLGTEAQNALKRRTSLATQAVEPLAQIFISGGQPTEEAFKLAQEVLAVDDYTPPSVLDQQIKTAGEGMGIRDEDYDKVVPRIPEIPGAASAPGAPEEPKMVRMVSPKGEAYDVPADQVEEALRRGWVEKKETPNGE